MRVRRRIGRQRVNFPASRRMKHRRSHTHTHTQRAGPRFLAAKSAKLGNDSSLRNASKPRSLLICIIIRFTRWWRLGALEKATSIDRWCVRGAEIGQRGTNRCCHGDASSISFCQNERTNERKDEVSYRLHDLLLEHGWPRFAVINGRKSITRYNPVAVDDWSTGRRV